jgi:Holliday junction resolvase
VASERGNHVVRVVASERGNHVVRVVASERGDYVACLVRQRHTIPQRGEPRSRDDDHQSAVRK